MHRTYDTRFVPVNKSPEQFVSSIKLRPRKPKAGKNITFLVKLTNEGKKDVPYNVAVWVRPFNAILNLYAPYIGEYCAFEGTTANAGFDPSSRWPLKSDVIEYYQSKTVKVTVPAGTLQAGTYVASFVASPFNCDTESGQPIFPSYAAITIA
jgi:hypothetical protein